jgi:hypothetical protein
MGLPHFGRRSRCVSKKPPQNTTVAVSWSNDNGNKWLNPLTCGIGAQDLSKTTHIQQVEHRGGLELINIGATDADDVWAILLLYWKIGRSRSRQTFGVHPDSPTVIQGEDDALRSKRRGKSWPSQIVAIFWELSKLSFDLGPDCVRSVSLVNTFGV